MTDRVGRQLVHGHDHVPGPVLRQPCLAGPGPYLGPQDVQRARVEARQGPAGVHGLEADPPQTFGDLTAAASGRPDVQVMVGFGFGVLGIFLAEQPRRFPCRAAPTLAPGRSSGDFLPRAR